MLRITRIKMGNYWYSWFRLC